MSSSNGHSLDSQATGVTDNEPPPGLPPGGDPAQPSDSSCSCTYRSEVKKKRVASRPGNRPARSISNVPHLSFDENFRFNHSSCTLCNGYFGPCYGEPVCSTCHAFVYPVDPGPMFFFSEKGDDGDSGNDEPSDMGPERNANQNNQGPPPPDPDEEPRVVVHISPPNVPVSLSKQLELLCNHRDEGDNIAVGLVDNLPPEVLLTLFSYLDDLSLWTCAYVCKRWRHLLMSNISDLDWEKYTTLRWPLFRPLYSVEDWFRTYGVMLTSAPCRTCVQQMSAQSVPPGDENSWRRNRLKMELKTLRTDPPEGIEAIPLDVKCCHWQATIRGPADSPYAGGLFYLYLQVPYSYPMSPPTVRFVTRIFHPNVSRHGDVGIDSIQHNWSLALTLSKVLISIQSLLTDPYCQVCMEPEIGSLYKQDKQMFENVARAWTWRYAMHDALMPHRDPPFH